MTDEFKATLAKRAAANDLKMDVALWNRDAARGGVGHANRLAEHAYEAIQEVRNGAIARRMTTEERDTYQQDEARAQERKAPAVDHEWRKSAAGHHAERVNTHQQNEMAYHTQNWDYSL